MQFRTPPTYRAMLVMSGVAAAIGLAGLIAVGLSAFEYGLGVQNSGSVGPDGIDERPEDGLVFRPSPGQLPRSDDRP
jgi:hypothetical protein